jgi:hypothetical protein
VARSLNIFMNLRFNLRLITCIIVESGQSNSETSRMVTTWEHRHTWEVYY